MDIKKGSNRFYIGDSEESAIAEITFIDKDKDTIVIDHTYVSHDLRGKGIASELVGKVVQFAKEENKKVIPVCSFAKEEFIKHKDYLSVLDNATYI